MFHLRRACKLNVGQGNSKQINLLHLCHVCIKIVFSYLLSTVYSLMHEKTTTMPNQYVFINISQHSLLFTRFNPLNTFSSFVRVQFSTVEILSNQLCICCIEKITSRKLWFRRIRNFVRHVRLQLKHTDTVDC